MSIAVLKVAYLAVLGFLSLFSIDLLHDKGAEAGPMQLTIWSMTALGWAILAVWQGWV